MKFNRPSAVVGGLSLILLCVGCGGGGGNGDAPLGPLNITSTPTLDGPVGSSLTLVTDSSQRPEVGDTFGDEHVHGLFSFDISQIPAGAVIVSAEMKLTSIGTTGDPADAMGGAMPIDHLSYGSSFPSQLSEITNILQSGVALWDDVTTVGARTFDVTSQVLSDQAAARPRSQFRLRGLLSTNTDSTIDLVTFAGGENQNGDEPILTISFQTP